MRTIVRAALAVTAMVLAASAHPPPATAAQAAPTPANAAQQATSATATPANAAQSATSALTPGTHARTLTMPQFNWLVKDPWNRSYLLHVPAKRKAGARAPLVIALHGGLNDGKYIENQSGLDQVSDANGFLVAYPDGFMGTWNGGGCCSFARVADIDDVSFIDKLISTLVNEGVADPKRIYLTGFSNGGGLAYKYACDRPGKVAALGVVSGALATPCGKQTDLSILAFHGTADFSVPYFGGGNMDYDVKVPFLPVNTVADIWRRLLDLPALTLNILFKGATGCMSTGRGHYGDEVELCTIIGGGHEWPQLKGTAGVDGSKMLWAFFSTHPRIT
ncbi:hypothetical protein J4573_53015 [Actinomadura barringtoniae]|uniref:Polyhydroxybutyrate depolymerase n=1 Tax=Actinomadura barringtoniae TaxID=1427535 RepID=A0A939PNF9_9ACTN|nr:PHB depolymerase family esterase [Actinomadura barringtoniae]MBO2455880.1 hypothetical protein [Actinomadura barringtoniae]